MNLKNATGKEVGAYTEIRVSNDDVVITADVRNGVGLTVYLITPVLNGNMLRAMMTFSKPHNVDECSKYLETVRTESYESEDGEVIWKFDGRKVFSFHRQDNGAHIIRYYSEDGKVSSMISTDVLYSKEVDIMINGWLPETNKMSTDDSVVYFA